MTSPLAAAQFYIDRGLLPIPVPHGQKKAIIQGWPSLRLTKQTAPMHFNGVPANVGILLGDDTGTTDVDLDAAEAVVVRAEFLPDTGFVFGRKSKPASHHFYRCDPPVRTKKFLDPINKACLVELRCQKNDGDIGFQTVVPPSLHPSGEPIRFESGCTYVLANVDAEVLQTAVTKIAAASLLVRHWPPEQAGRNAAFIALAGALARAGWSLEDALAFHRAIYRALWGPQADLVACKAELVATYEKHGRGFETTGKRTLSELISKQAVATAFSWLGIRQPSPLPRDEEVPPPKRATRSAAPPLSNLRPPDSESLEDLLANDSIVVPELMIEGLLPKRGLVLLGGRPKDGKSWLACQIALSVATGESLAGWLKVTEPGRVQLWALEDRYALTKDKVSKLLAGRHPDGLRDLRVFEELQHPILQGGDQIIRKALDEHPTELIILDSLFKLTGAQQPNGDICQRDYDVIDRVRKIAIENNCAAVIVMHTKKGARGGNPIENIIGTSGTSAAADAVVELKRTSVREGKLTVVGRLVQQEDYALAWHAGPDTWGWEIESSGDEASLGETSQEVLAYLAAQGACKPASIASALRKSFGSVWMALQRLQERGKAVRRQDKRWDVVKQ